MRKNLIQKWEKLALILSIFILLLFGFIEIYTTCLTTEFPIIVSILTGLFSGIVATIVVLFFERKHEQNELRDTYLKYQGLYKRIACGQDNTLDENLEPMRKDNTGLFIRMTYLGGHEFLLEIDYWKSYNAKAKGFVEFNPKDKKSAKGNYRYIQGIPFLGHYGRLELSWDDNKNEMIVFYQHQFPRDIPFNPDNNRGWEVWAKIDEGNL